MPADTPSAQSDARFRCSECGRVEGLIAISYGYMIGRLAADGRSLDDYSEAIEDTEICEDTITCPDHPFVPIDELIDGVWCRWHACQAEGCVAGRVRWMSYGDAFRPCTACKGKGGHDVPLGEAVAR